MSAAKKTGEPTPSPEEVERYLRDAELPRDSKSPGATVRRKFAEAWLIEQGLREAPPEPPQILTMDPTGVRRPTSDAAAADPGPLDYRNAEAEKGVVAGMMADNARIPEVLEVCGPEDFGYPRFRVVARAIVDLHARGEPVDPATVIHELRGTANLDMAGGPEAVAALASAQTAPETVRRHAEIVRDNSYRRNTSKALKALQDGFRVGKLSPDEALSNAQELLNRAGDRVAGDDSLLDGVKRWPEQPGEAFWQGPVAELVALVDPYTEADPVAVFAQVLVAFSSIVGRKAHWRSGTVVNFSNLYAMIVGHSGQGRKGTGMEVVRFLLDGLDDDWSANCIYRGMTSGEGFLEAMRDPVMSGRSDAPAGVLDKRALWVETEFGGTLAKMNRDGNTLAAFVRDAWDGMNLCSQVRKDPARVTEPYVSLIGHITFSDVQCYLTSNLITNGFANRFLWICSRRSKELPHGGDLRQVNWKPARQAIAEAIRFGSNKRLATNPLEWDREAYDTWTEVYGPLTRPRSSEVIGKLTQRAHTHVRRVAVLFALLDRSPRVAAVHLNAALEFWDYCERTITYVFGDGGGGKGVDTTKEKVYAAVRGSGEAGVSAYEVNRSAFGGRNAKAVAAALRELISEGLIDSVIVKSGKHKITKFILAGYLRAARLRAGSISETQSDAK